MSRTKLIKNHTQFENTIENIIRYAQDIIADLPYKETKISTDEKKMFIEALLLRACALWENFIEKEVVLLIDLDPSKLMNNPAAETAGLFIVPENKRPDFFRALIEAIYKKYIETKFGGLPSSLTTFARSKDFYKAGEETYIALKNAYHLEESDFIEKGKYLIE